MPIKSTWERFTTENTQVCSTQFMFPTTSRRQTQGGEGKQERDAQLLAEKRIHSTHPPVFMEVGPVRIQARQAQHPFAQHSRDARRQKRKLEHLFAHPIYSNHYDHIFRGPVQTKECNQKRSIR